MNFQTIFTQYIGVLEHFKNDLKEFQFSIDQLKEIKKTIVEDKSTFTYSFSNFKIVIPKKYKPSHTIPRKIENITITLTVEDAITIKFANPNRIEDPFVKLDNFNIVLNSSDYFSSWHLDRHVLDENEMEGKNLHPIYHMTFGGHKMECMQEEDTDTFGKSLIVRSPRLMHPPLELISGLDFIFRHFVPKNQLGFLSHKPYNDIVNKVKKNIWLPFALAMAKNYCNNIQADNVALNFDDVFVRRVMGHV